MTSSGLGRKAVPAGLDGGPRLPCGVVVMMEVDEAIGLAEEGINMATEIPPAGATFAASVSRKLKSIAETIGKTQRVSPKQAKAIENMVRGVQKWLGPQQTH